MRGFCCNPLSDMDLPFATTGIGPPLVVFPEMSLPLLLEIHHLLDIAGVSSPIFAEYRMYLNGSKF